MPSLKPTQTIIEAVKDISAGRYRLPSIQRSFVWEAEQVYKLLDSLMRDYPIGAFLLWKPGPDLQVRTRLFVLDHKPGQRAISGDDVIKHGTYLVLDGQQRLQSLYLAFSGSYDGKRLYFKVDSSSIQDSDTRFQFQFLSKEEATDSTWRRISELVKIKIEDISEYVDTQFPSLDDSKKLIKKNLGKFIQRFSIDTKLSLQEVEETLPYDDVLEVFVRVNSGGTVLTKSDLVFSTVILNSPNMESTFSDLVDDLNGNGDYDFDIDFLIKTSFVLFDIGAKYDVAKLKSGDFIKKLDQNIDAFKRALFSTVEFLKNDARILSKRFLRSDLALTPIVDYIFRQPHQQIPEGEAGKLRQYLYMSFFLSFYSYGADTKLDVIHKKIVSAGGSFPAQDIGQFVSERTKARYEFTEDLLKDTALVLNVIQGGVYEIPKKRGWSLEQDHIFPNSVLTKLGVPNEIRDDIGNLRYLAKTRNILKSATLPDTSLEFYGSHNDELNALFSSAVNSLTPASFTAFCTFRRTFIFQKVRTFLGFTDQPMLEPEPGRVNLKAIGRTPEAGSPSAPKAPRSPSNNIRIKDSMVITVVNAALVPAKKGGKKLALDAVMKNQTIAQARVNLTAAKLSMGYCNWAVNKLISVGAITVQ